LIFSYYFDVLILKIKNIIVIYFKIKNILKNKHYHTCTYTLLLFEKVKFSSKGPNKFVEENDQMDRYPSSRAQGHCPRVYGYWYGDCGLSLDPCLKTQK
jgi:hypothetical protein